MTASPRRTKAPPEDRLAQLLATLEARSKLLAFFFGLCFVTIVLVLAIWFPNPTAFQYTVFRITLALAAAGIAGVIPGMIRLKMQPGALLMIHAGGALAVFVMVYLLAPAALPPEQPAGQPNNGGVNQTFNSSQIGAVNNTVNNFGLSEEQYEAGQKKLLDKLLSRLQDVDGRERFLLEQRLQEVSTRLADTEKSYAEKNQLLKETREELKFFKKKEKELKDRIPEAQIDKAIAEIEHGDTETAEQIFDTVADESNRIAALAAFRSGRLAEDRLDYEKAMRQYKKAVAWEENNPDYLLAAGKMARTLADYKHAEEWLKRLLKIREAGKDELALARLQHDLAWLYSDQGRYAEAELLYQHSLEIKEESLGKNHIDVATTLNNLASLYDTQGRYEKADPLFQRALEIKEKSLGKDHTEVAATLNNLALLYDAQGRYEKAESLFQRALKIDEESLGIDHLSVATTLNNLAELYKTQGRYAEADPLYKRALYIKEKSLGGEHPSTATTLNNIAGLYRKQHRYKEAEPLYKRALKINEKLLSEDHPDIAHDLNNLAALYCIICRAGTKKQSHCFSVLWILQKNHSVRTILMLLHLLIILPHCIMLKKSIQKQRPCLSKPFPSCKKDSQQVIQILIFIKPTTTS